MVGRVENMPAGAVGDTTGPPSESLQASSASNPIAPAASFRRVPSALGAVWLLLIDHLFQLQHCPPRVWVGRNRRHRKLQRSLRRLGAHPGGMSNANGLAAYEYARAEGGWSRWSRCPYWRKYC